jgi:hypothetical protein
MAIRKSAVLGGLAVCLAFAGAPAASAELTEVPPPQDKGCDFDLNIPKSGIAGDCAAHEGPGWAGGSGYLNTSGFFLDIYGTGAGSWLHCQVSAGVSSPPTPPECKNGASKYTKAAQSKRAKRINGRRHQRR